MKEQFLKKLNNELRSLKKEERKKYLDNYEEIILDKVENGISEETAVSDLGNVKQISGDILVSYVDMDGIRNNIKYFNKMYVVFDAILIAVSYILAYCLRFESGIYSIIGIGGLPFHEYMSALIYVIPGYLILYYLFKLYTVKGVQKKIKEAGNILLANAAGLVIFSLLLVILNLFYFSRMMIVMFFCINVILEIFMRTIPIRGHLLLR
jgi:uncharacterized membrane protein